MSARSPSPRPSLSGVGQTSCLPVSGASLPCCSGGRMPPELAGWKPALHALFVAMWIAFLVSNAIVVRSDSPGSQTNSQPTVILVVGAPGEEEYGQHFAQWAKTWEQVCQEAQAKTFVLGLEKSETTDHDLLKKILEETPKESLADLWLVLLGHGTFDGKESKFNLRGPDLSAAECAEWLKPFQRPIVVINCASSSGPYLNQLAGLLRVVITSTRSGFEQNYSRFGEFMAKAISDPESDLDKDGQTSVLEAYLTASKGVADFYKSEGRLATEHALLDDNGDGKGTPADWFRGIRATKKAAEGASIDGLRAHQIHLVRSKQERELSPEVRAQRDKIELEIARLRDLKEKLSEEDYYRQLEPLLINLALLYEKGAGKESVKATQR